MLRQLTIGLTLLAGQISAAHAVDLMAVYEQALDSAPQLKSAKYKVEVGNAETGQTFGQMLPQVSGAANWSTNNLQQPGGLGVQSYKGTRYFVSLSQTVMDFGKFWDWRKTKEMEKQYDAENIDAQQNLMVEVVKRYLAILDAQDQLSFINQEKITMESHLQQVNRQFEKQLAKVTDVYEVEAKLDQVKADEIEAESQLLTSKEALKELTNSSEFELARLRDNVEYKPLDGKLEEWLEVARSESPMLAAQRSAIAAASDNVEAQKAKYLPVVDFQMFFYDTNTGYQSQIISSGVTKTEVAALNVNVPIFTGGTTTERVNEARSTLNMKSQENEGKIRALIKETSEAFTLANAYSKRILADKKAKESASKSLEAMQTGFKYGVNTIREVLEAQQAEFKAQRDLAKSKYNYIANRVRFLKAIGMINEDNLVEVNQWLQH